VSTLAPRERPAIDKLVPSVDAALADLRDGMTVMVGGFGEVGVPFALLDGLVRRGVRDLTIIHNNAGNGERGVAALFKHGQVRKLISSFPIHRGNDHFRAQYDAGKVEVEVVPQFLGRPAPPRRALIVVVPPQ
jgi:3-oxoadipate CoA-transferase alpha subunit